MVARHIRINIDPSRPLLTPIQFSQGDHGEGIIIFDVYNLNDPLVIPEGGQATITGLKPDGNAFVYEAKSVSTDGSIVFDLTNQMTAVSGIVKCELRIMSGNDNLGTPNFFLLIEEGPANDDTSLSESDLPLMEEAIEASIIAKKAEASVADAITEAQYTLLSLENGRLIMYRSDASTGKLDFGIKDHKNLEVTFV